MNDYDFYEQQLREMDPDVLVSDLELTTEELMAAVPSKVAEYIEENWL